MAKLAGKPATTYDQAKCINYAHYQLALQRIIYRTRSYDFPK